MTDFAMEDSSTKDLRRSFLWMAILFQGSLLIVALFAGWWLGNPVWSQCRLSFAALGYGMVGAAPMCVFLVLVYGSKRKSLADIRELLAQALGRPLAACGWLDLVVLALLAGFSEEFLFRGVIEPFFSRWGRIVGVIGCNVLFGICHAVTPTYALLAGLMGVYLSSTLWWTGEPNLIVPICCHSLYDLIAFFVVRRSLRRQEQM